MLNSQNMKKTLQLIRLELFHELGKSLAIDRDIFLDDNLDDDRTLTSYVQDGEAQQDINRFPYKLSFTAAVVVVRGQLTSSVNGRQYQVSTGDALIVQNGSVVEAMMCSSDLKIIAMAFTDGHDVEYLQRSTSEVSSLIQHRAFPVTVHLEEEAMSNYIRLYMAVKGIYRFTEQRFRGDVVRGFLQISTSSFAGRMDGFPTRENVRGRANELYLDFMDDLQRFCTQERSVEFYAGRRCVCAKYFARQVKAVSGKSPGRIIRERVLIEAKALLNSTDLSVRQVCDTLHFPNESFFCRWFKEASGRTGPARHGHGFGLAPKSLFCSIYAKGLNLNELRLNIK